MVDFHHSFWIPFAAQRFRLFGMLRVFADLFHTKSVLESLFIGQWMDCFRTGQVAPRIGHSVGLRRGDVFLPRQRNDSIRLRDSRVFAWNHDLGYDVVVESYETQNLRSRFEGVFSSENPESQWHKLDPCRGCCRCAKLTKTTRMTKMT